MRYLRNVLTRHRFAWMPLLGLALLCVQGAVLHIHDVGHDHLQDYTHSQHHAHDSIDAEDGRSHVSGAHLATDISHDNHHHSVVSEIDVSPDGFIMQSSADIPVQLLLYSLVLFPLLYLFVRIGKWHRVEQIKPYPRYLLFSQLRAPPL